MTRRALITGATAGLGAEFARQLSSEGFETVLVARDEARLAERARQLGTASEVLPADLTDRADLERVARRLGDPSKPIDILVSNAGAGLLEDFATSDIDDERNLFELLAWAPLRLAHAALPGMRARGRGGILTVASLAARVPSSTYGAAKAHAISLSKSISAKHAAEGVRATALLPGFVRTEFHERMGTSRDALPAPFWAEPETVVRDGLRGLRRGTPVVVSDWRYRLASPLTAVIPDAVLARWSTATPAGQDRSRRV